MSNLYPLRPRAEGIAFAVGVPVFASIVHKGICAITSFHIGYKINMALKRKLKDGTIKPFTEDKDVTIKRLTDLVKELTETLADVMGYNDKPIAAASTYSCYS